jgi:hypothetical protein
MIYGVGYRDPIGLAKRIQENKSTYLVKHLLRKALHMMEVFDQGEFLPHEVASNIRIRLNNGS